MDLPATLQDRLSRLAADQRAAATCPPGPVLCVAPAGSGKTTTLVARIAWLVATGVPTQQITAVTFNRRAADELAERLNAALDWVGGPPGGRGRPAHGMSNAVTASSHAVTAAFPVRVRTFHALGLEILRSAGEPGPILADRDRLLRAIVPGAERPQLALLDTAISRFKLDLDLDPGEVAAGPDPGPLGRAYVAYEAALAAAGQVDFDDLVRRALRALQRDTSLLERWRSRCAHLLVDETQDVDRSQLRLALLLAAPANRIFLVGDDDQSIYGWRLADVRRILGLAAQLPGLRRVDLKVNYRCPAPVLARAVRLVQHNRERFAKTIRPGPAGRGELVLAPEAGDDEQRAGRVLAHWHDRAGSQAVLARTNRELEPAAAVVLQLGLPFQAAQLHLLIDGSGVLDVLRAVHADTDPELPLLVRIERVRADYRFREAREARSRPASTAADLLASSPDTPDDAVPASEVAAAMLGWAVRYPDLAALEAAIDAARTLLATLRRDDAPLTLATAHATKGLEFDHVAVIGMDAGRFPSARAVAEAEDPARALEEERRLAYVAWTRARRSLTLVYDPSAPSPFLLEAFHPAELGMETLP